MPNLSIRQDIHINNKTPAYYISLAAQGLMGALGLCAGFLYLKPANECAIAEGCGKWLTDLTNEDVSTGAHFGVGMLSFGVINAYFSFDAIPKSMQYILKNKNLAAKIQVIVKKELSSTPAPTRSEEKNYNELLADIMHETSFLPAADSDEVLMVEEPKSVSAQLGSAAVVLGLTGVLTVQLLIVSLRRTPPAWQTVLTFAGGVPGSLYGTVGILENIVLPLLGKAAFKIKKYREEDAEKISVMNYHAENLRMLRKQVRANWHNIMAQLGRNELDVVPVEFAEKPMHFLFHNKAVISPKTKARIAYESSLATMSLGLAYCFTIPFLDSNTKYFEDKGVDSLAACYVISVLLSSAQIYGNIQLAHHAISSFTDLIVDKAQGKPVDSLFFQLSPKLALLALTVETLIASMSYSLVYQTTEEDYRGPEIDTFIYIAMAGIVIYHLGGLMEFANLLFRRFTKDPRSLFMLEVEQAVTDFEKLSPADLELLTDNDANFREMAELEVYDDFHHDPAPMLIPDLGSSNHLIPHDPSSSIFNCCVTLFKKKPVRGNDVYVRYSEDGDLPTSDSEMMRRQRRNS
jgi:hypothetical protein